MKRISLLIATAILLVAGEASAKGGRYACSHARGNDATTAGKSTMADAAEGDYDIKHLKFNLHVTDTSVFVSGDVTTTAQVSAFTMSQYVFELANTLTIDSAKINGVVLPVVTTGSVRKITLPSPMPLSAYFTAQVFYHGMPPGGSGFFNGVTHSVSPGGTHSVFTVSDPWVAQNWWPAKQSVNDKIDSVDMFVTVPSGVVDGSNGVLVNIDSTTTAGYWQYHWKTNYSITYYLISIAVARYTEYRSYVHFSGSSDSMLIQNFFMDTATFNPAYKPNFDSIGQFVDFFSSLYGRYPFWKEKYGVCYTTLPGGMEHQTMTTIGVPNTYIIAHELAHQWFGDNVCYKTWGDVWLSEGFATFSEQLYINQFWGAAQARAHRASYLSTTLSNTCGKVYVDDTSGATTLFDNTTVYAKAQGVVNMLRYIAPQDSLFFKLLRNYQSGFALGHASTADLRNMAESIYGISLDTFFNQWIYGKGYPVYKMTWNQVGSSVWVKLVQTRSCPASYNTHFSTPVQLQLHAAGADTIIKVYSSADTQVFTFNWSPTMTTAYLNPDIWTVLKQNGAITKDATLGIGAILPENIRVLPNPSKNYWQIETLPDDTALTLTDMTGRVLWQGKSENGMGMVPGEKLPAGNYLLRLTGSVSDNVKLVRW
jgi:aminopeptidase N